MTVPSQQALVTTGWCWLHQSVTDLLSHQDFRLSNVEEVRCLPNQQPHDEGIILIKGMLKIKIHGNITSQTSASSIMKSMVLSHQSVFSIAAAYLFFRTIFNQTLEMRPPQTNSKLHLKNERFSSKYSAYSNAQQRVQRNMSSIASDVWEYEQNA